MYEQKTMRLQTEKDHFLQVEVSTAEDEAIIREANNQYYNQRSKDRIYRKWFVSLDTKRESVGFEAASDYPTPEEAALQKEEEEEMSVLILLVQESLELLTEKQKEVVTLHYYHGHSLQEIARRLELDIKAVRERHSYALRKIRSFIEGHSPKTGWITQW